MTGGVFMDAVGAVCLLGVIYCAGGIHGIFLAYSERQRFEGWAARVQRAQQRINEAEEVKKC